MRVCRFTNRYALIFYIQPSSKLSRIFALDLRALATEWTQEFGRTQHVSLCFFCKVIKKLINSFFFAILCIFATPLMNLLVYYYSTKTKLNLLYDKTMNIFYYCS